MEHVSSSSLVTSGSFWGVGREPPPRILETSWELRRVILEESIGGDPVGLPPTVPGAVVASGVNQATIQLPDSHGTYRLYAVARDPEGAGAAHSLPLLVGRARTPDEPLPLPWFVYQDDGVGGPWVPSGHMGDPGVFELDTGWTRHCASPPSCLRITSTKGLWSGVAWQFPANNWGEHGGGQDLSDARWLVFDVKEKLGMGSATFGALFSSDEQGSTYQVGPSSVSIRFLRE